ncbi:MAG: hypothetical protein QOG70_2785, partial [Solirubrobacteraceae bacterium]|nr:hypothetical protein [Solirubrobacteraceae bacterium]
LLAGAWERVLPGAVAVAGPACG